MKKVLPVLLILTMVLAGCKTTEVALPDNDFYPELMPAAENRIALILPLKAMSQNSNFSTLEESMDLRIEHYLESHGYEVPNARLFYAEWQRAIDNKGGLYDGRTGQLSQRKIVEAINEALAATEGT